MECIKVTKAESFGGQWTLSTIRRKFDFEFFKRAKLHCAALTSMNQSAKKMTKLGQQRDSVALQRVNSDTV